MTDRPIIFSAPMVRALLAGRKSQTRRLATSPLRRCEPGDRLWVREEWKSTPAYDDLKPSEMGGDEPLYYPADGATFNWAEADGDRFGRRRPGMHMPRWASRLTLIVEAVRVEPLQAIGEADAIREGVTLVEESLEEPVEAYRELWSSLHSADGQRWDDNPDVLALTFRVEPANIDQAPA